MENNPILKTVCASLTCCGCILDYKANFEGETPSGDDQQANEKQKFAWVLAIWRLVLVGVGLFNLVMDGILIHSLWTDDKDKIKYAYYMLGASLLSFFSDHVVWGPIINEEIRLIRNWMDRLDVLGVCFLSALICFWIEDVSTIYLFFKVDGVFDRDSISDMMNLVASIAAGCLGLLSLLILPFFIYGGKFGVFNKELSCGKRCCNCFDCLGFCCLSSSLEQQRMTRQERKEQRQKSTIFFTVIIIAIITTAYPSYAAFFGILLGGADTANSTNTSPTNNDIPNPAECKDSTSPFYSNDVYSMVRCDLLEGTSSCVYDDIRMNCPIFCNSCNEVFVNSNEDVYHDNVLLDGISDELLIMSVGLGVLWVIVGIIFRIRICCTSGEAVRMEEEKKIQDRIDRWHGVERSQQMIDRYEDNPQTSEC